MRRNAAELGRNASKRSGEICRVGSDERGRTLVNKLLQFITTPPRLGDVMIGQKTSIADEESGAKHVKLEERPVPPVSTETIPASSFCILLTASGEMRISSPESWS